MDKERCKRRAVFERIGRRWRKDLDKAKEYQIVEAEEAIDRKFTPSFLLSDEYQRAQRLKQRLLRKYEGKDLEDVIKGREVKTDKGTCYCIVSRDKIHLRGFTFDRARDKILSNLKLIYGIGKVTEEVLKERGCRSIEDLRAHPRFGPEANRLLEAIDSRDAPNLIKWIGHWIPRSHPLMLYASGLYDKDNFICLDIETMGLFNRPIILFGMANIRGDEILVNQYLIRDISEELCALIEFTSHIGNNCAFITFNGRVFDIPYIKERLAYYGMEADLERPNFDLLYFSRQAWKEELPNCRLTTLERYLLGRERRDDVPSALVPEFYETYLRTGNIGPVVPIIEHNRQDLITLTDIFSMLCGRWK